MLDNLSIPCGMYKRYFLCLCRCRTYEHVRWVLAGYLCNIRASEVVVGERRGIALARHLSVALLVMVWAQVTIVGGVGRMGESGASDHGANGDKGDDGEAHCDC